MCIFFRETVFHQALAITLSHVYKVQRNQSYTVHGLVKENHLEAWVLLRSKSKAHHRRGQLNVEITVMEEAL